MHRTRIVRAAKIGLRKVIPFALVAALAVVLTLTAVGGQASTSHPSAGSIAATALAPSSPGTSSSVTAQLLSSTLKRCTFEQALESDLIVSQLTFIQYQSRHVGWLPYMKKRFRKMERQYYNLVNRFLNSLPSSNTIEPPCSTGS